MKYLALVNSLGLKRLKWSSGQYHLVSGLPHALICIGSQKEPRNVESVHMLEGVDLMRVETAEVLAGFPGTGWLHCNGCMWCHEMSIGSRTIMKGPDRWMST